MWQNLLETRVCMITQIQRLNKINVNLCQDNVKCHDEASSCCHGNKIIILLPWQQDYAENIIKCISTSLIRFTRIMDLMTRYLKKSCFSFVTQVFCFMMLIKCPHSFHKEFLWFNPLTHLRILVLHQTFLQKILAFDIPLPLGISSKFSLSAYLFFFWNFAI